MKRSFTKVEKNRLTQTMKSLKYDEMRIEPANEELEEMVSYRLPSNSLTEGAVTADDINNIRSCAEMARATYIIGLTENRLWVNFFAE